MIEPTPLVFKASASQKQRANLARLERVNRALQKLEEWECAQIMPEDIRPVVEKPILGREALESLRRMILEVLVDMEESWQWHN